jgi:hypothetical protein
MRRCVTHRQKGHLRLVEEGLQALSPSPLTSLLGFSLGLQISTPPPLGCSPLLYVVHSIAAEARLECWNLRSLRIKDNGSNRLDRQSVI